MVRASPSSFCDSSAASPSLPDGVGRGATVMYCGLSGVGVCLVNATALRVKGRPVDEGGVREGLCVCVWWGVRESTWQHQRRL